MKKLLIALLAAGLLTACGGETDTDAKETKEEVKQEEPAQEKTTEAPNQEENPYKDLAVFAFGKNVKCDVIEGWGDDNKPKITRINITTSGEPMVQPFLIKVFSYLKKAKEKGLDYESVFFILRSKKTDGKEYPYAKIEIEKKAADSFDFATKDPVDLKTIAKTYDTPDTKETSAKNTPAPAPKNNLNNEDTKTVVTAFIKAQIKDMCDVSTETLNGNFIIHLYPKSTELKTEIAGLMIDKTNPQLLDGWNQMSKGILELSKNVKSQVDENVSIMLHNPVNTENVLFVTLNDIVFSDFTKDN